MSEQPATITRDNAATLGDYGEFQKQGMTRISLFTVPPGTTYQTPEGLRAEDEDTRIAFDVQGGVYPIRESVFQRSYAEAAARDPEAVRLLLDVVRHWDAGDIDLDYDAISSAVDSAREYLHQTLGTLEGPHDHPALASQPAEEVGTEDWYHAQMKRGPAAFQPAAEGLDVERLKAALQMCVEVDEHSDWDHIAPHVAAEYARLQQQPAALREDTP